MGAQYTAELMYQTRKERRLDIKWQLPQVLHSALKAIFYSETFASFLYDLTKGAEQMEVKI